MAAPRNLKTVEKAIQLFLAQRGTATASLSDVARHLDARGWRELLPQVRAVAARLVKRNLVDAYQHGRPVNPAQVQGPVRLRLRAVVSTDYRRHPEQYRIGRGEEGVLTVEPYKSELLPKWRFATPDVARRSARALWSAFLAYGRQEDFVGMDMARKFLQMGWTRSRRYANHASGRKYVAGTREVARNENDSEKAQSARIFFNQYQRALEHPRYLRLKAGFLAAQRGRSSSPR